MQCFEYFPSHAKRTATIIICVLVFDFNDPLLVDLLQDRNLVPAGDIVVALLFLSPGRHAGIGGDVEMICEEARRDRSDLRTFLTDPLGEHPAIVDLLEQRVRECLDAD